MTRLRRITPGNSLTAREGIGYGSPVSLPTDYALTTCPKCRQQGGISFTMISALTESEYFGCRECGHVWRQPKVNLDLTKQRATPLRGSS
jgi:RNase P subunit RPR2